jgi:HK97 family phage prohead protease
MEFPAGFFYTSVEGHDDLIAFQYDFTLDGKALTDSVIEETEDGDLIIEGWAAVFEGLDREGENFQEGAFQRACKAFVDNQASLCYHHKRDHVLGKVLELEEVKDKGLRLRARVDGAIKTHPVLGTIYQQIKKGTFNGLSVGGFFRRLGNKIVDMDLTEVSVTGVPVHTGPKFSVVAGKALSDLQVPLPPEKKDEIRKEILEAEDQINSVIRSLDSLFTSLIKAHLDEDRTEKKTDEEPTDDSGTETVTS